MGIKLMYIGLCVQPHPYNGFQQAFIDAVGKENYFEISTGSQNLNTSIIELFSSCKPDLVFMQIQAPDIVWNQTMDYMKQHGAYVINWTGDKRNGVPQWMINAAPFVNLTSFSNMEDVREMKRLGYNSEYLEIGYDPEIYKTEGTAYPTPEIVFMANNYGVGHFPMSEYRIKLVQFLRSNYGERFGVYGSGWADGNGNVNHSQTVEAQYYRGAKIAINCSHFNVERYNSDRLLRVLGTGCFCLSAKHTGMEVDYTDGVHLKYFNTFDELKYHIDYYLQNEDDRKKIAENGRNLVLNRNTFRHQVENIIKFVK